MNNTIYNPLKILKDKYKESWSGCIEVAEPKDNSISWQIYLLQGKLQYVNTTNGQQERLNYLWQKFKLGSNCPQYESSDKGSEYLQLCQWMSDKQLSSDNIRKLLFMFVKEGLVQVLSIEETTVTLNPAKRIKKSLVSFDLKKILANEQVRATIKAWQEVRKYCYSPSSRLYLEQRNALKFYKIWKEFYTKPEFAALAKTQKLSSFVSLFVAKSNLYEIATKANLDTYFLIKSLKQPIEENILQELPFAETNIEHKKLEQTKKENSLDREDKKNNTKSPSKPQTLIACIDDSKTVQKQVKMTLEAAGYRVLSITDPTVAIKELSKHQAAIIFMDINMPNINGYDLCSLLRKSHKFKEVPIVMLTGRDGMIDRVRAKIVGANDYLTKPCDPHKLIGLAKMLEKPQVVVKSNN